MNVDQEFLQLVEGLQVASYVYDGRRHNHEYLKQLARILTNIMMRVFVAMQRGRNGIQHLDMSLQADYDAYYRTIYGNLSRYEKSVVMLIMQERLAIYLKANPIEPMFMPDTMAVSEDFTMDFEDISVDEQNELMSLASDIAKLYIWNMRQNIAVKFNLYMPHSQEDLGALSETIDDRLASLPDNHQQWVGNKAMFLVRFELQFLGDKDV